MSEEKVNPEQSQEEKVPGTGKDGSGKAEKESKAQPNASAKEAKATPKGKYYWVRFNARSNPTDTEGVELTVNGEVLIMQRDQKVPIPARFKECADNALRSAFKQLPNKPRKELAPIRMYPYSELGEATEQEFLEWRRRGTEKVREDIDRFGYNTGEDE